MKRLWLEVHRPELAIVSPSTAAAYRAGNRIGEAARRIYAHRSGGVAHYIPYDEGLEQALAATARLLRESPAAPLFEATARHGDVLIRADILLPLGRGWRLIEVKAATEPREEHAFDCAIQSWVLQEAGVNLTGAMLAHVDSGFRYPGEGHYDGLLIEHDVSADVVRLIPEVPLHVASARATLAGAVPEIGVGKHCFHPWECPFIAHCWPSGTAYPVQDLGGNKAVLGELVAGGYRDLRDVPANRLTERQRRIQRVTRGGRAELSAAAAAEMAGIGYPRYYLDFETVAPPVPLSPGTRPYEVLPFQWSCHYEETPGALQHADYLDLSGVPPMRRVAESLIRVLGRDGPVLTYTNYERSVIRGLVDQAPDLEPALAAILDRLVDLHPVVQRHYYHPSMRGSWSLKAVLPAVAPEIRYEELEGIQEGTEASEGYLEAIDPVTSPARKAELDRQLRRYCRFDTQALVRLAHFLGRAGD